MSWSTSHHSFSKSERGFTLVEVLVAISILAILLSSIYGIFSSVSLARERLDADSAVHHRARVLFDRLGRELRGSYFQPGDDSLVFTGSTVNKGTIELELTTSAVSPLSQSGSGITRVLYRLANDQENEAGGFVLLRSEAPVHKKTDLGDAGMMRLVPGIQSMILRFYANGQWHNTWDGSTSGLPELVEIEITLLSEGKDKTSFISAFEVPKVKLR